MCRSSVWTGPNIHNTVPADVLAPNIARTSAEAVLPTKLDMFTFKILSGY